MIFLGYTVLWILVYLFLQFAQFNINLIIGIAIFVLCHSTSGHRDQLIQMKA